MAGHTHHGSRFRALSPLVEACSRCMHCSGKPSNRTKLPDTMGNRRHFPTPGLPNPVATSLGQGGCKASEFLHRKEETISGVETPFRLDSSYVHQDYADRDCPCVQHKLFFIERHVVTASSARFFLFLGFVLFLTG